MSEVTLAILGLIFLYLVHFFHAMYEVFIDSQLARSFNFDGRRTELENNLMHKYQMPFRGAILLFSVMAIFGFNLGAGLVLISMCAWIWIWLDVLANLTWLKGKKWYEVGITAKTDQWLSNLWLNWSLKFFFLIVPIAIAFSWVL